MNELKSIIWSSACFLISLLFLITTMTAVVAITDESFRKQIINDLPKTADIAYYLTGLEKAVDFCLRHTVYMDTNMAFGIFMVDANLKELVKEKRISFAASLRLHLEKLLVKTNALTRYFHKMVHKIEDLNHLAQKIQLTQLFYNRTTWFRPCDRFNRDLLKQTKVYSPEMLEKMYGKWENYLIFVVDLTKYIPTAAESDECLAQLSLNPLHNQNSQDYCDIPNNCQEALDKGSDYGYGLLYRILLMIVARSSRGCLVMASRQEDKFKTDKYCMMCFNEAEYIALNNFGVPDLMFEQIALCGVLGHAQFIRNYWLKSLLEYQTPVGCFTQKLATGDFNENLLREGENDTWGLSSPIIMNGQCNGHFTAVAAMALSNALRYIIETYY